MTATLAATPAREIESSAQTKSRLALLKDLRPIFDAALADARGKLELASEESLHRVAVRAYDAFEKARNAMDGHGGTKARKGVAPFVPGNDPHTLAAAETSELSVAMATVYGFTTTLYTEKNPKSIETLKAMQPMAREIHERGLCIFT